MGFVWVDFDDFESVVLIYERVLELLIEEYGVESFEVVDVF